MSNDIIDLQEVLERVEGDKELLVELIEIFLEDYPKRMENFRKGAQENNFQQVKDVAHSLKGAAANISAKKISAIFLEIENMAKNSDLSNLDALYDKLDDYLKELKCYLEKIKGNLDKK